MLSGETWAARKLLAPKMSTNGEYWHVFKEPHAPTAYNSVSKARFSLASSNLSMFYVGDTLNGVLWETVLRDVEPDDALNVDIDVSSLAGMRAVKLRLLDAELAVLDLRQPGLRGAGFGPSSREAVEVARLIATPSHDETHAAVATLFTDLVKAGVVDMPALAWVSRQHSGSNVYLSYEPPGSPSSWQQVGDIVALDDDKNGHQLIHRALEEAGFQWSPALYTAGT